MIWEFNHRKFTKLCMHLTFFIYRPICPVRICNCPPSRASLVPGLMCTFVSIKYRLWSWFLVVSSCFHYSVTFYTIKQMFFPSSWFKQNTFFLQSLSIFHFIYPYNALVKINTVQLSYGKHHSDKFCYRKSIDLGTKHNNIDCK